MTKIILGPNAGQWVMRQMEGPAVFTPESMTAMGCERDGRMVAGFVFENWNGQSMVAHMAIQGRASKEFYRFVGEYCFVQCGIYKLIAPIPENNWRSINFVKKVGFRSECRIMDAHPDGDILIFTLIEKDCRFLKGMYVQAASAAIA